MNFDKDLYYLHTYPKLEARYIFDRLVKRLDIFFTDPISGKMSYEYFEAVLESKVYPLINLNSEFVSRRGNPTEFSYEIVNSVDQFNVECIHFRICGRILKNYDIGSQYRFNTIFTQLNNIELKNRDALIFEFEHKLFNNAIRLINTITHSKSEGYTSALISTEFIPDSLYTAAIENIRSSSVEIL